MSRLRMYQNDLEKHLKSKRIFHRLYLVLQMQLLLNKNSFNLFTIKLSLNRNNKNNKNKYSNKNNFNHSKHNNNNNNNLKKIRMKKQNNINNLIMILKSIFKNNASSKKMKNLIISYHLNRIQI